MATRTIANGGGNYNAIGTWVEGAVPTSADDVVATATSGNLTVNVASACRSIDLTNYVSTLTVSSTFTIGTTTTIGSNIGLKFVAGMTLAGAGAYSFTNSSATPHTIDFGGKTVLGAMTINSTATIASSFTSSSTVSHTGRTLDLNGNSVTCTSFTSSGASTRALTFSSGTITATLANAAAVTFSGSGLTVSASGGTIVMSGANAGFSNTHTGLTFGTLSITGSGSPAIAGVATTFVNLTRTGTAALNDGFYLPGGITLTVTGVFTVTGAASNQRVWVTPGTRGSTSPDAGVTATIALSTTGTSSTNANADFMDVTVNGTNIPATGTRMGDCWGNTGITFDASRSLFWVGNAGSWSSSAHWSLTSGGTSGAATPLPQDDATFDSLSMTISSQSVTCDTSRLCRNLTLSNGTASLDGSTVHIFGSVTSTTLMFTSLIASLRGRGTHTLSMFATAARLLGATSILAPGGTYTLTNNVFLNGAANLVQGTLALGSKQLTVVGTFLSNSGFTRVLDTGTGILNNAFGGLTFAASGLTVSGTGTFSWTATSGTPTLITAGVAIPNLTINGPGQTVTLSDTTNVTGTVTVTSGTFSINSRTLNCATFTSSGSTARTVSFAAAGALVCSGNITLAGSTLTWTPSTGTVTMNGGGTLSVTHASLTLGAHVFAPGDGKTITVSTRSDTVFGSATVNGTANPRCVVAMPPTATVTGAFTVTGNSVTNRVTITGPAWMTTSTISAASASLTHVNFVDVIGSGVATWTGTDIGTGGASSGITPTTGATQFWVNGTGNWNDTTRWASGTGGSGGTGRVPLANDDVVIDVSSGTGDPTVNATIVGKSLTIAGSRNITFTAGLTSVLLGALTASTTAVSRVTWNSSSSGSPATIVFYVTVAVAYVDVADSTVSTAGLSPATSSNGIDGGGVTRWVFTFTKSLTDNLGLTDSRTSGTARTATDALGATDTIPTRSFSRSLSDALGLTDQRSSAAARTASDALGLTDTRSPATTRTTSDALGLTDSTSKATGRTIADPLGLTDNVTRAASRTVTDPLGLTDPTARSVARTVTDQLPLTDQQPRSTTRTTSDALALSDSTSKATGRETTDPVGLTDSISQSSVVARTISDQLALTDATSKSTARSISDPLGMTDPTASDIARTLADQLALTDTPFTVMERAVSDALGLTDANVVSSLVRVVSDALGLTDNVTRFVERLVVDLLGLVDLTETITGLYRQVTDDLALGDFFNANVGNTFSVTVTDTLAMVDAIATAVARAVTDQLGFTDTVTDRSVERTVTDLLPLTDLAAVGLARTIADQLGLSDLEASLLARTVTDPLGLVDSIATIVTLNFPGCIQIGFTAPRAFVTFSAPTVEITFTAPSIAVVFTAPSVDVTFSGPVASVSFLTC